MILYVRESFYLIFLIASRVEFFFLLNNKKKKNQQKLVTLAAQQIYLFLFSKINCFVSIRENEKKNGTEKWSLLY